MSGLLASIQQLAANGDPETILELAAPPGAAALAARVFREDRKAAADFTCEAVLAAFLRSLAAGQEADARRALAEPTRAPRKSLLPTPAAALHGATADARRTSRASAKTQCEPNLVGHVESRPPSVALTTQSPMPHHHRAPARIGLAEAGTRLQLRLDRLPAEGVVSALTETGLDPVRDGGEITLDATALDRLAADADAVGRLALRLCRAVPRLGYVGGGAATIEASRGRR